jgi:hypothetical protein
MFHNKALSALMTYHWVCNISNTTVSHLEQELLTLMSAERALLWNISMVIYDTDTPQQFTKS